MPEAYIYDHVRTPRGRGKADGALHEVTALALATVPLQALKERNNLAKDIVDDVIRPRRGRPRCPDQPVLRLRPRCGEFCRRPNHERPA